MLLLLPRPIRLKYYRSPLKRTASFTSSFCCQNWQHQQSCRYFCAAVPAGGHILMNPVYKSEYPLHRRSRVFIFCLDRTLFCLFHHSGVLQSTFSLIPQTRALCGHRRDRGKISCQYRPHFGRLTQGLTYLGSGICS